MDDLEKLLNLMEEINNIYMSLYKLECLGDRENSYFFRLVNELKNKLVEEENLFNIFVNSSDYLIIKEFLSDENSPVFKRIKNYISKYENKMKDYNKDDDKMMCEVRKLYNSCTKNIFLVYLSYLQEYIDTTNDKVMREKLLSLKYYDAFIRLDIGELLINNDFYIAKTNYVDLYLIVDMLCMKKEISYDMIDDANLEAIKEMIIQLFSITDDKYKDYDMVVASKNIEFMLRACLSLIGANNFEYMKDDIFLLMDELSNDNNGIAFDIIDRVLETRVSDKSRIMMLSLRPIDWY